MPPSNESVLKATGRSWQEWRALLDKAGRTAVHFHQEKLPDAKAREEMRARWKRSLEQIARMLPG